MSRHESRQKLARDFGATDIVTELVLKDWVTDTNETLWASNSSMSLAKSASELIRPETRCVGIVLVFIATGAGNLGMWEAGRRSMPVYGRRSDE
jgi:hypothetical protein